MSNTSQNVLQNIVARKMNKIKPSPTLVVINKAISLKKQGLDVISLGAGEPDFDTPDNIKEAAITAIKSGFTKYTAVEGTLELKTAIQQKFKKQNNLDFNLDEIIVSTGGKQVIYNLFMASLDEDDEVIIPAPYWVSYPDMVLLSGGVPKFVECDDKSSFKLTKESLSSAITTKTKWLILNSPSNPTGAAYTKEELEDIASVLRNHPNVYIMSDDIYEHIVFDDFKFLTLLNVAPDLKDRIFIVNGVSKSYSMTGWRIGYGAGPKELVKAMSIVQSQSTSNPSSISQAAATEALNGTQDFLKPNSLGFQRKRDLILGLLSQIPNFSCVKPEGAFYIFPSCKEFFGLKTQSGNVIKNDVDFVNYILEDGLVALVQGSAFGLDGFFRISYATSEKILEESAKRIINSINKLI